jgi:hypothetical protein
MHWATPEERSNWARRGASRWAASTHLNPKARKTSPLALLERSMRGRVPALIKLKYELMAASRPSATFAARCR